MHRYRTVAQISLILSILNLIFAAPIAVREIRETRRFEMAVKEDVAAMAKPNKWPKLEAVDLSPRAIPNVMASTGAIASPGAMTSSEHGSLSEASISETYPTPPLSSDSSDSGSRYLWLLNAQNEPPNLRPQLHDSAPPHLSSTGLETPPSPPGGWQEPTPSLSLLHPPLQLPRTRISPFSLLFPSTGPVFLGPLPPPPPVAHRLPPPPPPHPLLPDPSSSGTSAPSEIPPSPQHMGSDLAPTETYSLPHGSTPLPEPRSGGPVPSHNPTPDGSMPLPEPMSGGPVPSHNPTPDGSMPLPEPIPGGPVPLRNPTPEVPPDNAGFFNKNVMKKVGIVAGTVIVGSTIAASILASHSKHHKHRDSQDS